MSEGDLHHRRVKRLVAQDPEINEQQMKEFRMQLEQTLESSEAKAKQTRRRILIAGLVYLGGMFSYMFYMTNWGNANRSATAEAVGEYIVGPLFIASLAAMVIGVLLLVLYLIKYGPRLSRARFDLQTSMMLDLQQQVKQLRENVERQKK
jgi:hypothetical protein